MDKELETFEKLNHTLCLNNNEGYLKFSISHIDCQSAEEMSECLDEVEQALLELKSIKEANPSEALENLKYLKNLTKVKDVLNVPCWNESYEIVEKALLKAQEPKHYLKWEDLEFTKDTKCQKAKMNGKEYTLHYFILCDTHKEVLIQDNDGSICTACNEKFFNDLHLESVEE